MHPVIEMTDDYLHLSGRMTRGEVDAALAAIAEYGSGAEETGPVRLQAVLDKKMIVMAGGLEVRDDATGVRIHPGCCAGLEDWRGWAGLLGGTVPWLGHSPTPGVEFAGGVVRLRQDEEVPDGPVCAVALADLPELLEGVRRDLSGFLGLVRAWAPDGLGERLAARLDDGFHVSAPL